MKGNVRVTVGEKAAVCGLLLAGIPYYKVCEIVGRGRKVLRAYIPADLRATPGRPQIDLETRLKARRLYEGSRLKVAAIAYETGLNERSILNLSKHDGWTKRGGRKAASWYEREVRT